MMFWKILFSLFLFMNLAFASASAAPLGAGFTYQGRLDINGIPFNGAAHLRVSLWDTAGTGSPPSGGIQIGNTQTLTNVPVANGIFVVMLNAASEFGPQPFNGDARWLQIEVCSDAVCTTATTLSARQPLTGTPYALGPWNPVNGNLSYMTGNVGIGTAGPTSKLEIAAQDGLAITGYQPFLTLRDTNAANERSVIQSVGGGTNLFTGSYLSGSSSSAFLRFENNGTLGIGTAAPQGPLDVRSGQNSFIYMDGINGDLHYNGGNDGVFGFYNDGPAGGRTEFIGQGVTRMTVTNTGNVGIGTVAPTSRLEVRGDIKLGSSGEYYAPAGQENLRILRGTVSAAGDIVQGSGFTVAHPGTGSYQVTFNTAFSDWASVVVTLESRIGFIYNNTSTNTSFTITTRDTSEDSVNSAFHFIVMGPR